MKNIRVLSEKFSVFGDEIFYIFELACFRNVPVLRQSTNYIFVSFGIVETILATLKKCHLSGF